MTTTIQLRHYQTDALEAMKSNDKGLIHLATGSGKSRIIERYVKDNAAKNTIGVIIVPSIALVRQFYNDYFSRNIYSDAKVKKICSDRESRDTIVRDYVIPVSQKNKIKTYLKGTKFKLAIITYQSYGSFQEILAEVGSCIDFAIYDEAHHITSELNKKHVFDSVCEIKKQFFFTATPVNRGGVVMLGEDSMVGERLAHYTIYDGIKEKYLHDFRPVVRVSSSKESLKQAFDMTLDHMTKTGNTKFIFYHSQVDTKSDTCVFSYFDTIDNSIPSNTFLFAISASFIKHNTTNTIINKRLGYATCSKVSRDKVLEFFARGVKDDERVIILSCQTLGEGIDTKQASGCHFVDKINSHISIIQRIGRVLRVKDNPKPVSIVVNVSINPQEIKEDNANEYLRKQMRADGDFSSIFNVLAALKQEDEDLFNYCIEYPPSDSEESSPRSPPKTLEDIVSSQTDEDIKLNEDSTPEDVAAQTTKPVQVFTPDDLEEPIQVLNEESEEEPIRIVQKDDGTYATYKPKTTSAPKSRLDIDISKELSQDLQLIWGVENIKEVMEGATNMAILESSLVSRRTDEEVLDELEALGRIPSKKQQKKIYDWVISRITLSTLTPRRCGLNMKKENQDRLIAFVKKYSKDSDEETLDELEALGRMPNIKQHRRICNWMGDRILLSTLTLKMYGLKMSKENQDRLIAFVKKYRVVKSDEETLGELDALERMPHKKEQTKLQSWLVGRVNITELKIHKFGLKMSKENQDRLLAFVKKYRVIKTADEEILGKLEALERMPNQKEQTKLQSWLLGRVNITELKIHKFGLNMTKENQDRLIAYVKKYSKDSDEETLGELEALERMPRKKEQAKLYSWVSMRVNITDLKPREHGLNMTKENQDRLIAFVKKYKDQ